MLQGIGEVSKKLFLNVKAACCIFVVLVIITISLVATSIRNVDFDEYGIVYNSISKQVSDEVRVEGKHILPVGSELIIFKRRYITMEFNHEDGDEVRCLSRNGLEIVLDMTMQYQWNNQDEVLQVFRSFGSQEKAHEYLTVLSRESFREVCSYYDAVEFYDKRGEIENRMLETLTTAFADGEAHATLGFVQLLNIELPSAFENAIRAGQLAEQDINKAVQEKQQVITKAETRVLSAMQQAEIQIQRAQAEADAIMFAASQQSESLASKFGNLALSMAYAMNSTGLSSSAFIGSYLQSKLLREATSGPNPIVAFS